MSENYSVSIETKELSRELYQQMKHKDNDVIYLKTVDQYVTIMGYWVTDKHTRGVENVVFPLLVRQRKVFGVVNIVMYTTIALKNQVV